MALDAIRTASVVALLVCATAIGSDAPHSQDRQPQDPPAESQSDRSENRQSDADRREAPPAPQPSRITNSEPIKDPDSNQSAQAKSESERRYWLDEFAYDIRATDLLLVLFTGLLVFYTGRLWHATAGLKSSADAANKLALENMNAARRAWMSIECVKIGHPTEFTEEGVVFSISVTIKNLGQTPATSVEIIMESYFNNPSGFLDAEKLFKDRLRHHNPIFGHLIFPEDTFTQRLTWSDARDKIQDRLHRLPSGGLVIGFSVFIGISYRIIGDEAAHITYHSYGMLNVPIGTIIPEGTLVDLPREPFLAGEAD